MRVNYVKHDRVRGGRETERRTRNGGVLGRRVPELGEDREARWEGELGTVSARWESEGLGGGKRLALCWDPAGEAEVSGGGGGRPVWRAETVEVMSLASGRKSMWGVDAWGGGAGGTGKWVVPVRLDEPRFRLRVEFSRVAGFDESELWRTESMLLPGLGEAREAASVGGEVDGARIRLHSLTAPGGVVPGGLGEMWNRWSGDAKAYTLWVEGAPAGWERRLTLVRATDERGRAAEIQAGLWSGEQYAFGLIPPPGATRLDFTLALHRSRVMDVVLDLQRSEPRGRGARSSCGSGTG